MLRTSVLAFFVLPALFLLSPDARAESRCGGPEDHAVCDRDPYRCPCDAYGRCGRSSCKVTRCSTDGDRATCGRNPRECPCDYFGNCEMASCNSARAGAAPAAAPAPPRAGADTAARFGGIGTPVPASAAPTLRRAGGDSLSAASRGASASTSPSGPATSAPATTGGARRNARCPHCGRVFAVEGDADAPAPASSPAAVRDEPVHPDARLTGRYCSSDDHRRSCRENPAFCPCGYYHDCGMNSCRAPSSSSSR